MYIYYYTDKDIPEIKIAGKSIIRKDGRKVTLEVEENDSSFRYRALMKKPQFVLKFSLPAFVEIPVGAWCEFLGQTFTLTDPENIKKNGVRNIEYTMMMGTDEDLMSLYKMRNSVDHRLKYSMCATPKEFIQEIVANLNSRTGGGWTVGTCIESSPKTIEFNHVYIDNALQLVADIFKTEWENVDKKISLRKVEYFKNDPLPLSYGKGNGFIPGVGRTSQSDEKPIKRLYVQGGDKNIDYSKYGSKTLLLPKSQTLDYEGRKYQTDADGYYIERIDKISDAVKDDSLDLSEIYPSRVGEVSDVIAVKPEKNFYDIVDTSIPDNLDYNKYLIEGETMTIIFQSGMLAGDGKEFEVTYHHTAKTVNGVLKAARRFEIVPQEIDGQIMPNEVFKPAVGDSYAIFGCSLPQEYICDNDSKTGASWDMFREGARMLYEHEDQKFTFTGTLQGLYAKRNWLKIGGRLKVGAYILFSDPQFAEEGVSIRITGIKEFLTSPYTPTIEISNSVSGSSTQSKINHIDSIDVEIDNATKTIINFTKRRFRDALQTIEMLEAAQLNFSESVNPITVQTMAALIGDESLQFRFVKSKINLTPASYLITYDNVKKQLHCPHGFLQHMTLGISSVSSSHKDSEYKVWEMSEYTSPVLTDGSKKYYLYARVSSTNTAEKGEFLLSETGIAIDSESGYYHLLAGVLNSELEEERSYVDLYGFTEILPGRITTDRIVSSEGSSFFDLLNNAMKLGDALDFNTKGDGKMRVKGTIVQSESGDESYIGCFRGTYNNKYVYYNGDEVTYTVNGLTSTYRYIFAQPTKGIPPTDATHWKVIAQGSKGEDGISPNTAFKSTAFIRSNTAPATPKGGSYANPVPSGWSDGIPAGEAKLWASTRVFSSDGLSPQQSVWSTPRQMTDTAYFDVEYSSVENPEPPVGHPNTNTQWGNDADENTIWMATSNKSNGVWTDWQISRIKGERGEDGTSIKIKGTLSNTSQLPTPPADPNDCYIIGHDLWVWDGDSWRDAGQFKGEDGKNAYIHIKYAKSLTENDWSANNGETPDKYIGIYCDNTAADRLVWSLYTWSKWQGEDGFGYEYIYKRTATEIAPDTPTAVSQNDGFVPSGWTDDPSGVSAEYPYEWLCYRKQTDGVWGAFKGSFSDPTKASLWGKYAVMTNLNLLEGTGFQNNDVLRAWDVVNQVSPKSGVTVNDYNIGILTGSDGFQGRNAFRGGTKYSLKSINYKEILRQPIRQKLKPSTWYTLSYWARCVGDSFMYEDIVGSAYLFQTYDVYLTTGKKYQMSIQGFISPDAANAGKTLRVYINNTTWSWSKMVEINSTANTTASIEFDDVPSDGEYKIGAYSYPNTTPAVDVTVRRLYLVCLTQQTVTYVYPSCIDTTVKGFVDGVEKTISSDGATNLGWGYWAFHTFTFKTKATLPTAEQYVLFRLMPALTEKGNIYYTDICMPKLEEGKEATPYKEHDNDSHAPYYELRYAKNGSTKVPPALSVSMREPSGWSTVQPSVGELEYLWQTTAKKNFDGSLIENWSTPVRITPYDGKDGADGKSPALVFRGVYNASKNYYGNANRVDCVKYNSTYYRARIDAPNGTAGFSGHAPTDSDYWNAFGASFESVATDLLLAENASIGDWFHSGGKIVSTLSTGNKIELDASIPQIKVTSEQSGGDYSEDTSLGSEITISGSTGVIRTQAKTSSSKVSYMSPSGIFSNVAETQAVSSITGYIRKAAMVALGYGSLAKSTWEMNKDEAMLAGVYGVANNNTYNGAPAYGGYFYDLKACGLILNVQYISDSNSEYTTLDKSASQIISLTNKDVTRKVYLPSDAYVGRVVFLHQMGAGALRVYAGLGQHIYDDTTENTYYDIFEGQTLMAIFGIWSKNNVRTEVWIVRRFKY